MSADEEIKADIRNKLQAALTVLELISEGKDVSKELIEIAKKDLNEAVAMCKNI
jgi:hypothetical protein